MRQMPPRNETERAMLPVQNLPLEWAEEGRLWSKESGAMFPDWKAKYYGTDLVQQDVHHRCMTYFQGLQWILNYYTGKPISTEWMYAWTYPPLWCDLLLASRHIEGLPEPPAATCPVLKPQQQLSMVLPMESWWLIREPALKVLPTRLPAFWPTTFAFESLGKRWLWECYPKLPILTPARMRACL